MIAVAKRRESRARWGGVAALGERGAGIEGGSGMGQALHLWFEHAQLRQALRRTLATLFDTQLVRSEQRSQPAGGDIVLCDPRRVDGERCRLLTERGVHVVVLDPLPTAARAAVFSSAGAHAYLPMDIHVGALTAAITAVLTL
jgi:hypothetical protein